MSRWIVLLIYNISRCTIIVSTGVNVVILILHNNIIINYYYNCGYLIEISRQSSLLKSFTFGFLTNISFIELTEKLKLENKLVIHDLNSVE